MTTKSEYEETERRRARDAERANYRERVYDARTRAARYYRERYAESPDSRCNPATQEGRAEILEDALPSLGADNIVRLLGELGRAEGYCLACATTEAEGIDAGGCFGVCPLQTYADEETGLEFPSYPTDSPPRVLSTREIRDAEQDERERAARGLSGAELATVLGVPESALEESAEARAKDEPKSRGRYTKEVRERAERERAARAYNRPLSKAVEDTQADLLNVRESLRTLALVATELEDLDAIKENARALFEDDGTVEAERAGEYAVGEAISRSEFYRSRVRAARAILSALAELLEPEIDN